MKPMDGTRSKRRTARETADRLHSAAIRLLRTVRRRDTASGLGPARLSALSVLVFRGPSTLKALAAAEQVKPPTMSRIVNGLAASGLIRRIASPVDARALRLEPTARGRRVLERARDRRVALLAGLLGGLEPGELKVPLEAAGIL